MMDVVTVVLQDWSLHLMLNMIERECSDSDWDGFIERTQTLMRQRLRSTIFDGDRRTYADLEADVARGEAFRRYNRVVQRYRKNRAKPAMTITRKETP